MINRLRLPVIGIFVLMLGIGIGLTTQNLLADAQPPLATDRVVAEQTVILSELKAEIINDPLAVGYAGKTPFEIASLLNQVGLTGETVDVAFVSANQLQGAVDPVEYLSLLAPERDLWEMLLLSSSGGARLDVRDPELRAQVLSIWGPGTATRSNLVALQTRPASRAEALWGDGAFVTDTQVEEALLLP